MGGELSLVLAHGAEGEEAGELFHVLTHSAKIWVACGAWWWWMDEDGDVSRGGDGGGRTFSQVIDGHLSLCLLSLVQDVAVPGPGNSVRPKIEKKTNTTIN